MRIYLAGRYSRREELCQYRARLEDLGHRITSRWLNGNHQIDDRGLSVEGAQNERVRFAEEDRTDVYAADMLIAFTEVARSSNSRGGRHVELGMALGRGKKVVIVGPRENVFCCLPEIRIFDDFGHLLSWLSGLARALPSTISMDEYQKIVSTGEHSYDHLVPCSACGDIDGCHVQPE